MKLNFQRSSRSWVLWSLILCINYVHGQTVQSPKDVIYLNYFSAQNTDISDKDGTISQNSIDLKINTPTIKVGEKLLINNVFNAKSIFNTVANADDSFVPFPENLYEFRYSLLMRHTISASWRMIYMPALNARSDFAEGQFNKDVLFPQLLVAAVKTSMKNPGFNWGFGINYNNNQGKNSVLPVLVLLYSKPKLNINARLPQSASITFMPSKKFEYGFSLNLEGSIAHLQNEEYPENANYLKRQNIHIFPHISTSVTPNLWLNLKAGVSINNSYSFVDDDFEVVNDTFENSLKPTVFMQLGISYRLNK